MIKLLAIIFCVTLLATPLRAQHHKSIPAKTYPPELVVVSNWKSAAFDLIMEEARDYSEDSSNHEIVGSVTNVFYFRMVVHDSDAFLRSVRDSITEVVHQLSGGIDANNANRRAEFRKRHSLDPFRTSLSSGYYANANFLSLLMTSHGTACCGGTGSVALADCFNIDLVHRKYLSLNDIVEKSAMHALDSLVRIELLASERKDKALAHPHARDCTFRFTETSLRLFVAHSEGRNTSYSVIDIPYTLHPSYFRSEFIQRLQK